jgi:hypothetical protein
VVPYTPPSPPVRRRLTGLPWRANTTVCSPVLPDDCITLATDGEMHVVSDDCARLFNGSLTAP